MEPADVPRILTYNVHRCVGVDGRLSPERVAEVIAATEPDIVALQEVDVNRARTGGVDQAEVIAKELGMQMHFHPALRVLEEQFGDAILTELPSRLIRTGALPTLAGWPMLEERGALWAALDIGGVALQVVNTHIGLVPRERLIQLDVLLGPDWLGHPSCRDPLILAGDFNAVPRSRAYRRIAARLTDAQLFPGVGAPRPTFSVRMPVLRIDHVFVSRSIKVRRCEVIRTPLARVAADHLPLLVEFDIVAQRPQAATDYAAAARAELRRTEAVS
jgi:endonuclease/exonuclease/phosphatase family metal-dependent hydrolase